MFVEPEDWFAIRADVIDLIQTKFSLPARAQFCALCIELPMDMHAEWWRSAGASANCRRTAALDAKRRRQLGCDLSTVNRYAKQLRVDA